jgi:hypothetical protein
MRIISGIMVIVGLMASAGLVVGQEGRITPPRLGIRTKQEKQDKSAKGTILKVDAVSPEGLGQRLGLRVGDIIKSVKIGDQEAIVITAPQDLNRCLEKIRDATFDNPGRAAKVSLLIETKDDKDMREQTIKGAILRSEFPDKFDGGTQYTFRKETPKNAPAKKPG